MNSNYKSIHAWSEGFGSSLSGCSPKLNPFPTFRKLGEAYVYLRATHVSVTHRLIALIRECDIHIKIMFSVTSAKSLVDQEIY